MSWKDESRRRRAAERRGQRGTRRASAMLLRQVVLHPALGEIAAALELAPSETDLGGDT